MLTWKQLLIPNICYSNNEGNKSVIFLIDNKISVKFLSITSNVFLKSMRHNLYAETWLLELKSFNLVTFLKFSEGINAERRRTCETATRKR